MAVLAALVERRPAVLALRRALPPSSLRLLTARSPAHLDTLLRRHFLEGIVLGAESARGMVLDALRRDFPGLPVFLYAPLRSDDADLLLRAHRERVTAVAAEGLDEPVLPRMIHRLGMTARRRAELLPLATGLDLTDSLQRAAWEVVVTEAPAGISTATLAKRLKVARETLSRRFAAGGAPSLKRAIDAVRLVAAGQLLANPGYGVDEAARLLGFSSASLLQRTARRVLGVPARQVAGVAPERLREALLADRPGAGWG